jgi:hypothetical protein
MDGRRINDDLQIDAHGFALFRDLELACLPPLSTNLSSEELVLVNGLRGSGSVEQERPVFDFERYWEVGALGDGVLKRAMSDETPLAGLWRREKVSERCMARECLCAVRARGV